MRKVENLLLSALLVAGAVHAQASSVSLDQLFESLETHQIPVEPEVAPVAELEVNAAAEPEVDVAAEPAEAAPGEPEVDVAAEPVVATSAALDVDTAMEESRKLYVAGEFEKAQKGFARIVEAQPENLTARTYLRKLLERGRRTAEIRGMDELNEAWSTGLVLRSYTLGSDAIEKMNLGEAKGAEDVADKFPEVDFPEGAVALYRSKMEKIFVRNTRENLAVLEAILDATDVSKMRTDVEQIEIEAKFVEVSEGTLEALGFEWRSIPGQAIGNPAGSSDVSLGGGVTIPEGSFLFDDALRGSSSLPLPFSRGDTTGHGRLAASGNWSSTSFEDTFSTETDSMRLRYTGSTPMDVVISALDQSTGSDVLSAPRIVTRDGEEATIRVGELHSFPEVYEADTSQATLIQVDYEDFEEKLLGIELLVTPVVDGDLITLSLNPRITELAGWQQFQLAEADSVYTHRQGAVKITFEEHDAVVAELPIFKKREIETEVTIADGSTIGMGGLMSEEIESFEDRVPVLGNLPLVGRFFRNEGERAIKRNLLMFVTAQKVDANGRIKTDRSFE